MQNWNAFLKKIVGGDWDMTSGMQWWMEIGSREQNWGQELVVIRCVAYYKKFLWFFYFYQFV